jgi:hypothetical protein
MVAAVARIAASVILGARARLEPAIIAALERLEPDADAPAPALDAATVAFGLDARERQALALVAAADLDATIASTIARTHAGVGTGHPIVATVAELCGLDLGGALGPHGRLRRYHLVVASSGVALPLCTLHCPPAVWTRLSDASTEVLVSAPGRGAGTLALTDELHVAIVEAGDVIGRPPPELVVVWGPAGSGRHAIATAVAAHAGFGSDRHDAGPQRSICGSIASATRGGGEPR